MLPRPCASEIAVATARGYLVVRVDPLTKAIVRSVPSEYQLGTGTFPDVQPQMDCVGFAVNRCFQLPRHRPGFNKHTAQLAPDLAAQLDVEDDINCNSMIGDALTDQDLCEIVTTPAPGCLLVYPTIHLAGHPLPFVGHVAIIVSVARCSTFDVDRPDYSLIDTVQCCGPNGRKPGVLALPGDAFAEHAMLWPKPEHTARMIRMLP